MAVPTSVDYSALAEPAPSPSLLDAIAAAFGPAGLGLIVVRGVPGYSAARAACLPFAHRFATLPEAVQSKYVDEASHYSFGWSHGKEKFEGKADTAKGSFYFNPNFDDPASGDAASIAAFPAFFSPNIWPSREDCAGFEEASKALGRLLVDAGLLLSRAVDAHVAAQLPGIAGAASLERTVAESRNAKARLLYYFPLADPADAAGLAGGSGGGTGNGDSWCGMHNDHGSLTALVSAMYVDAATGAEVPCPDPQAGLYVCARGGGAPVRVALPADCCAFQIGETAEILSAGVVRATPHFVRAAAAPGVGRATLAVFMEPGPAQVLACPVGADDSRLLHAAEALPKGVPPLGARWTPGATFGSFTERTLASYY